MDTRVRGWSRPCAFLLGGGGLAVQVVLFREALVRAGGGELALGTLLSAWLLAGGLGALAARRPRSGGAWSAAAGVAAFALGAAVGVAAWRGASAPGGALPGERQGFLLLGLEALLWNGPAAAAQGWLFARLAGRFARSAPRLMAWEALGAALAGVVLALDPVLAALPSAGALDTRHGRYEVVERGAERWLRETGRDVWLLGDGEPRAALHALEVLLLQVPREGRVLLAGAADLLPALLARTGGAVDLLLADPGLASLLEREGGEALAAALEDPRVTLRTGGTRRWLRANEATYAAIWLDDVGLDRADAARAVTVEGFHRLAAALDPGGCLGLGLGRTDAVAGSLPLRRAALLAAGCEDAGLGVVLLPDGTLLAVRPPATWSLQARELALRAAARGAPGIPAAEAAWSSLLAPPSVEGLNRAARGDAARDPLAILLSTSEAHPALWPPFPPGARHTDRRPRARLLAQRILERHARGGSSAWIAAVERLGAAGVTGLAGLALLLLGLAASRGRPAGTTAVAFRLTSSSLVGAAALVLVFERHQAHTGALYADLGWLGAAFLVGFALGSRGHRRLVGWRADLFLLAALAWIWIWAALPEPPAAGAALGALLLGAGVGAPVGAGALRRGAAWAFGLDLLGSAPGAFLAAAALLPVAGWLRCLAALAALKGVSLAVSLASRES